MIIRKTQLLSANERLRKAIYRGEIFLLPKRQSSKRLVESILVHVVAELGPKYKTAQFEMSEGEFLARVAKIKTKVLQDLRLLRMTARLLESLNFESRLTNIEGIRLRAVGSGFHASSKALDGYALHRDTWYANSASQINWWIPLDDLKEDETFYFLPEYFSCPVLNNSADFNYDNWIEEVGFGKSMLHRSDVPSSSYPAVTEQLETASKVGFACQAGDILLFSGAHLHGTCFNNSGRTRFSIDFRTVHVNDYRAGLGAVNVDNSSRGTAMQDYKLIDSY